VLNVGKSKNLKSAPEPQAPREPIDVGVELPGTAATQPGVHGIVMGGKVIS